MAANWDKAMTQKFTKKVLACIALDKEIHHGNAGSDPDWAMENQEILREAMLKLNVEEIEAFTTALCQSSGRTFISVAAWDEYHAN